MPRTRSQATAFDYIAHPKILSQPDAIPEELISQALDKFLKQNEIDNDLVAISVPGQSALARFIQLPPVESSKVSEIVKYEARQQIPFALEDVVWDYQTLGKGTEESGFLLEAEVGLFAMKRDQVMNQLKPFTNAERRGRADPDRPAGPVQLFELRPVGHPPRRRGGRDGFLHHPARHGGRQHHAFGLQRPEDLDPQRADRRQPFHPALTKEMKLTFAKAEHLKCNATKSPDPRAVFQALRPVFNDYVSEIQRSIGYFSSVNREAKISKVVGLGNGFKLAGLQKFLQQNLQYEVERVESFGAISPDGFKDAALFEENILSFPVCYGMALQALGQTRIRTSLLPKEITTARTIARKKPWAVVAAALLLTALATSAFGYAHVYTSVSEIRFGDAEKKVDEVSKKAAELKTDYRKRDQQLRQPSKSDGATLVGDSGAADQVARALQGGRRMPAARQNGEGRHPPAEPHPDFLVDPPAGTRTWRRGSTGSQLTQRSWWRNKIGKARPAVPDYIVTLVGDHYHDETLGKGINAPGDPHHNLTLYGEGYVREQFLKNLQQWEVPAHDDSGEVKVGGIGITHATIADCPQPQPELIDPLGETLLPQLAGRPAGLGTDAGQRNGWRNGRIQTQFRQGQET